MVHLFCSSDANAKGFTPRFPDALVKSIEGIVEVDRMLMEA